MGVERVSSTSWSIAGVCLASAWFIDNFVVVGARVNLLHVYLIGTAQTLHSSGTQNTHSFIQIALANIYDTLLRGVTVVATWHVGEGHDSSTYYLSS